MSVSVAIIGTGPAGFYAADALIKQGGDYRIDLIDRLPSPYGLIRFGVAPDHQTTKKVSNSFAKTASKEKVRFHGNVEIGGDVSLEELRGIYDVVILAVGADADRTLGIPGDDKAGVIGSAAFVGWYNAHPDLCDLDPPLDTKAAVIIGNGNVAIDVARVLVKTPEEMASSDLPDYAGAAIQASAITDVYMVGRRGPIQAKFTNIELREMGNLEEAVAVADPAQLPDDVGELEDERDRRVKPKILATLKTFAERSPDEKPKRVHFHFFAQPVEVLGGDSVEGVRFERTKLEDGRAIGTGEFYEIECGLVVPAVGYRSEPLPGAPFDEKNAIVVNQDGRVEEGLYAVGWIKRGPTGVISTNRPDGVAVAEHVAEDFPQGSKPGREALTALLEDRGIRPVSFDDWKVIEQSEIESATPPAPRRKLASIGEMLAVLDRDQG